jgi:aspartate-semialdehyde dehydrogenase
VRLFDKARHCKTHCLNNIIFYQIRQLLFIKNISFGGIVVNQKKFKVGIIGATGMVGQRFALLLENHPWFEVKVLAASARSAGKKYGDVVEGRWHMTKDLPEKYKDMVIVDAENVEEVASQVDFCFCAVNMKKDEIKALEERYAKAECPIVSNNSAHRFTPDVPMVIPEINADHIKIIDEQRKRLGTKRGFIAVKSNCSLQSYVPAIHPLKELGVNKVLACTYQAISGAGKTFKTWPEMIDNVIPYIGGEEEKSEQEPLKIWGHIENGKIVKTDDIAITAQCIRVPVSDGHTAAVFMSFKDGVKKPSVEEIIKIWESYKGRAQELELPSAPKQFLHYFTEPDRPQIKSERNLENGMAVSVGRLREDTQYDYKFVCMSHNTLRGAAGGAVLLAELLCAEGYMD